VDEREFGYRPLMGWLSRNFSWVISCLFGFQAFAAFEGMRFAHFADHRAFQIVLIVLGSILCVGSVALGILNKSRYRPFIAVSDEGIRFPQSGRSYKWSEIEELQIGPKPLFGKDYGAKLIGKRGTIVEINCLYANTNELIAVLKQHVTNVTGEGRGYW